MEFILRKWKIEDADNVAHFANNEKIACNLRDAFPHPYTVDDAKGYINSCLNSSEEMKLCRAIDVAGNAVGSIGIFLGSDVYSKSAELGYWLAEEFWNKGIMTSAVKQICKEAFERYDICRIYAEPFAHNTPSRKVLESAGFALEGVMKLGVVKYNKTHDYCMYALLKPSGDAYDI